MEAKELEKREVEFVSKLRYVRLTEDVINQLNLYQAGGTGDIIPKESDFTNIHIDDEIKRLTDLSDFILELYRNEDINDSEIILKYMVYIKELICHFEQLKPI